MSIVGEDPFFVGKAHKKLSLANRLQVSKMPMNFITEKTGS